MLQTIEFHYEIISHFREQYLKIYPMIQKLYEADYPAMFNYSATQFIPTFGSNVICYLSVGYDNASVSFHSLHKATREQMFSMSTHDQPSGRVSAYDGSNLLTFPAASEPYYFVKGNHPCKAFVMLHENDPEELEVMKFMLMSKYGMVDLTAILLNQVLINEDVGIQKYNVNLAPFVGLGEERESALKDLYFSTVIGLEHEAAKVG